MTALWSGEMIKIEVAGDVACEKPRLTFLILPAFGIFKMVPIRIVWFERSADIEREILRALALHLVTVGQ